MLRSPLPGELVSKEIGTGKRENIYTFTNCIGSAQKAMVGGGGKGRMPGRGKSAHRVAF